VAASVVRHRNAVILLALLACAGGCAAQDNKTPSLLDDGIRLLGEGRVPEATRAFGRYKQAAPTDARAYFYSGVALERAGKLSAAALELAEAVRLEPRKPEYRVLQASVFARLGHRMPALDALAAIAKGASALRMETAWLWLLSETHVRLDETDEALRILDVIGERAPADARVDLQRGKIYLARGEVDRSLECLRRSTSKSANPESFFELGRILYQRNELPMARKALSQAVALEGSNPEYLHELGLVCLTLNEIEKALELLKRAEPAASRFPQIYYALGNAYQRAGKRALAAEYRTKYQKVVLEQRRREDQSREAGRLIILGEGQLDAGNGVEARKLFERAVQVEPGNWDAHGYLAEMLLASDEWANAHEHLSRMEEIDPDSAVGNYLMARYWYRKGSLEKSRSYAEKVKAVRPGHGELRKLLGDIYLELGLREQARGEYQAAVTLEPDRADFRQALSRTQAPR
jgi:Flp pilus assembly protein TadD